MAEIVPTSSPSIFDTIRSLSTLDQQAIIRPNNPPPGIAGYLMDVVGDEDVDLTSEITDHFIEDNTTIQDQIGLRPEVITVRGVVAELVASTAALSKPSPGLNPLPILDGLVPSLTQAQQKMRADEAAAATAKSASVTSGKSLYGYYDQRAAKQPNQTKQARIFGYFYQLWKGRQLFSVETPWGIFNNCAILTCRMSQSESSKYESDVVLTFKTIRIAGDVTVNVGQLAGRLSLEQSPTTQNGNAGTSALTPTRKQSILKQLDLNVLPLP